jgi:hypothetical protein
MGKTLAELIADAAASDDLELTAADGSKFKLSDVRGFRTGVETERQEAIRLHKQAENDAKEAKTVFDELQKALGEIKKQQEPPPKTKNSDWKKNPLYDELVPVIEAAERAAQEARELADGTKKSLELSQAQYMAERLRREWAEAKVKPKDAKFEEIVAKVLASKDVDELGLPTLSKYLYQATEGDRIKAAQDEAVAAAKKEWEKAQRASDVPKPGKFQTLKSEKPPIAKLDELTSAVVANDPDILAAMEGNTH